MDTKWTVIVADELSITRRAVATTIRAAHPENEVFECSDSSSVLSLLDTTDPTLVLVDLKDPGLDLVEAIRQRKPRIRIVVLAGYDQPFEALHALQAGADGFLVKGIFPDELMSCLRCVVDTGVVVTSRMVISALSPHQGHDEPPTVLHSERQVDHEVAKRLTQREREIFQQMAKGQSNKEIAGALQIAEPTVKAHVSRILAKLGQPSRAQAVICGVRQGASHRLVRTE